MSGGVCCGVGGWVVCFRPVRVWLRYDARRLRVEDEGRAVVEVGGGAGDFSAGEAARVGLSTAPGGWRGRDCHEWVVARCELHR